MYFEWWDENENVFESVDKVRDSELQRENVFQTQALTVEIQGGPKLRPLTSKFKLIRVLKRTLALVRVI